MRYILFDFFTVTYRNKIRKINWIKARLWLEKSQYWRESLLENTSRNIHPIDVMWKIWFDSQQPFVMGRSIVWRLHETNYPPAMIVDLPFSGREYVWGDPGDSLEKCRYVDFSSTVVLIAPYLTKRSFPNDWLDHLDTFFERRRDSRRWRRSWR